MGRVSATGCKPQRQNVADMLLKTASDGSKSKSKSIKKTIRIDNTVKQVYIDRINCRKMTQAEVAKKLGVSRQAVQLWLKSADAIKSASGQAKTTKSAQHPLLEAKLYKWVQIMNKAKRVTLTTRAIQTKAARIVVGSCQARMRQRSPRTLRYCCALCAR